MSESLDQTDRRKGGKSRQRKKRNTDLDESVGQKVERGTSLPDHVENLAIQSHKMWVPHNAALLDESGSGDLTIYWVIGLTIKRNNSTRIGDADSSGCDGYEGVRAGCGLCCCSRECDGLSVNGERNNTSSWTKGSGASPEGLKVVQSRGFGSRSEGEGLGEGGACCCPSCRAITGTWSWSSSHEGISPGRARLTTTEPGSSPICENTPRKTTVNFRVEEHLSGLNGGPADEEKQDKDRHARHHRFLCRHLFSFHPFRRGSFFSSALLRFLLLVRGVA